MTRFLRRLGIFVAIQTGLCALLLTFDRGDTNLGAAFGAKDARVTGTAHQKRLLLVGGSNVVFGLDSGELTNAFPEYAVTNLGLPAGLGLDFLCNYAESQTQRGDVILLAPEYYHFVRRATGSPVLDLMQQRPDIAKCLSPADWKHLVDHGLGHLKYVFGRIRKGRSTLLGGSLGGRRFNVYGDLIAHHGQPATFASQAQGIRWNVQPGQLEQQIEELNQMHRRCHDRGIQVVMAYVPVAEMAWTPNQDTLLHIREQLHHRLDIPILNPDMPPAWPDEMFFDTEWHLTGSAKQKRTADLIVSIRQSGKGPALVQTAELPDQNSQARF